MKHKIEKLQVNDEFGLNSADIVININGRVYEGILFKKDRLLRIEEAKDEK